MQMTFLHRTLLLLPPHSAAVNKTLKDHLAQVLRKHFIRKSKLPNASGMQDHIAFPRGKLTKWIQPNVSKYQHNLNSFPIINVTLPTSQTISCCSLLMPANREVVTKGDANLWDLLKGSDTRGHKTGSQMPRTPQETLWGTFRTTIQLGATKI